LDNDAGHAGNAGNARPGADVPTHVRRYPERKGTAAAQGGSGAGRPFQGLIT